MRKEMTLAILLATLSGSLNLWAQAPDPSAPPTTTAPALPPWDPVKNAQGWAHMDVTGTCVFFDPVNHCFLSWMKDAGVMETCPTPTLTTQPQGWLMDNGLVWVIQGTSLSLFNAKGESLVTETLPFEATEIVAGLNGFFVNYRTVQTFIEKRDFKKGTVLWTYGPKPRKNEISPKILRRITISADRHILVGNALDFTMDLLDSEKGTLIGNTLFAYKDAMPPALNMGDQAPQPIVWWVDGNVSVTAFPNTALPTALGFKGLVLAKRDISNSAIDFMGTELSSNHTLIGLQGKEAFFLRADGGLVIVSVTF